MARSDEIGSVCVCVPARNEAERLPRLLQALAEQQPVRRLTVALCINNSDDGSAEVAHEIGLYRSDRLDLRLEIIDFPPHLAHAGSARRRAMDLGLSALAGDGVLISTDADARPAVDWVEANLAAIRAGADMVGGRLEIDPDEKTQPALLVALRRWDAYWAAVRAIEDSMDPNPDDPAPRHGDHTGASLAIRAALYRRIGGVPLLPLGEDCALVEAGLAAGARLRHPHTVWTRVSARTEGRAAGGMPTDMSRMTEATHDGGPLLAPALTHWRDRVLWRRETRARHGVAEMLRREALLPPMPHDAVLPDIRVAA